MNSTLQRLSLIGFVIVLLGSCSDPAEPLRNYPFDEVLHAAGIDPVRLRAAVDYATDPDMSTRGLVVLRNGKVMAEAYADPSARENKHISFSVAKSVTSALVGIAINEGLLSIDDPVCKFYGAWDCNDTSEKRRAIKIRHLLTLTSGLDWHEDWSCPMSRPGLVFRDSDAVYMDLALFDNPPDYVLARPARHEPGEHFNYSTGDPALLSRIIESVTGMSHLEYARLKLFEPLGIKDVEWEEDDAGHTRSYAHLHLRTRDYAKLGQLYLQQGVWNGRRLVPADWVRASTDPSNGPSPWYAYLWHANLPVKFNRPQTTIPADAFMARGIFGQWIVVIPSLGVVVAKNANDQCALDEPHFLEQIVAAMQTPSRPAPDKP